MYLKKIYFSIIIPYFKNPLLLDKCLKSIDNQTLDKNYFEVIVIDDFSKTNLKIINNNFSNKFSNFSIINLTKNNGPGYARNVGIKKSKGSYLFFVDSDDEIKSNTLRKLFKVIKKKNVDIVSFNYELRNQRKISKRMRNDIQLMNVNKKLFIKLFLEMNYNNSVIFSIFKRSLIVKNKIKFVKGYHEDISFFFISFFYSRHKIFINDDLYIKNNTKNSIINSFSNKHIIEYLNSWIYVYSFLKTKYNIEYLERYLSKSFVRGMIGIMAILIIKIFKFIKNERLRRKYVNFLISEYRKSYSKYFKKYNLKYTSRYDIIFKEFSIYINDKNYKIFKEKIIKLL
tara:strand:- start:503 stop:1528 length:1026 start_codon:yes stop_codon:yes gene_type:complete